MWHSPQPEIRRRDPAGTGDAWQIAGRELSARHRASLRAGPARHSARVRKTKRAKSYRLLDLPVFLYNIDREHGYREKNKVDNGQADAQDAIGLLGKIELFESLDLEGRARASRLVKWRQFNKGTEIIAFGDDGTDVYFIASGSVRITLYSFTGKEISYQELGAGKMFGELSAIDRLPRTTNVTALQACRIGSISGNDFWRLIDQYPAIAAACLNRLAGLVRFLIDRVYQYGALDVKDRVRMEILRLAHDGMTGEDTAAIRNFPTHKEIASRVNTHREAVTRELNELSRMGLIEQHGRVLTVTTVNGLAELLAESI